MINREFKLIYDKAADRWADALPLGNGRLGAMVYGHTSIDRIQLNEDSLWYGKFIDRNNLATKAKLPLIQQKVLAGEIQEAEDLIVQYMIGAPSTMRHYEPLGELDIAVNQHTPFVMGWIPNSDGAEDYHAELDMMRGLQTITYRQDGVTYTREMFISYPDQVLCIRISADKPGSIHFNAQMDRCRIFDEKIPNDRRPGKFTRGGGWAGMLLDENHTINDRTLLIKGHASELGFAGAVRMVTDGRVENPYTQLAAYDATEVCLYLAGATDNRENDPVQAVLALLDAAESRGWDDLLTRHVTDFEPIMRRCTLNLGQGLDGTTDARLARMQAGETDNDLSALYFTFGRYLMVSGGRENSTALNLQGIWCHDFIPTWDSKYTININTQMNYWSAEITNLSEIHFSMFDLIRRMWEQGKKTAEVMYGCRGAMCHHNTDIYGDCAPQDVYMASTPWTTGGAWMALHLWEHYKFTLDKDFLREWYPVLRDFALFFVDFLIDDGQGRLVTCPSVSPENRYILPDGKDTPICAGPAMDNQILRALFDACVQANDILGLHDDLAETLTAMSEKLPQNAVGSKGQLLEWNKEVPEMTPGMGHISHLWGAYPGDEINWRDTPDLLEAVRTSLKLRIDNGAGRGGWPLAWYICEHARMLDSRMTGKNIHDIVLSNGTRDFLNGGWGVFQIDANLGGTAGIAEAILQSHTGIVHLLPALPPDWRDGQAEGFVARGGFVVDMSWKDGKLSQAVLLSRNGGRVEIRCDSRALVGATHDGVSIPVERTQWGIAFDTQQGAAYELN
ncbi:large protein [Clostridia bacterium]|nr:large protein [Clostridia bacterium]